MAIDDKNKVKVSRRHCLYLGGHCHGVAILIGIIGNALTANGTVAPLETASASETIVLEMATVLSKHSVGAALIAGLIFAGILACTMSTSDSQLLAASSSMSGESAERRVPRQAVGKADHAGGSSGSADYRCAGCCSGVGSEQLGIPCGILRMGRIRRNLWSGGADGAVLETLQQVTAHWLA